MGLLAAAVAKSAAQLEAKVKAVLVTGKYVLLVMLAYIIIICRV